MNFPESLWDYVAFFHFHLNSFPLIKRKFVFYYSRLNTITRLFYTIFCIFQFFFIEYEIDYYIYYKHVSQLNLERENRRNKQSPYDPIAFYICCDDFKTISLMCAYLVDRKSFYSHIYIKLVCQII